MVARIETETENRKNENDIPLQPAFTVGGSGSTGDTSSVPVRLPLGVLFNPGPPYTVHSVVPAGPGVYGGLGVSGRPGGRYGTA